MELPIPSCQEEEDYMKENYSKEYYGEVYDESEPSITSTRGECDCDELPF